MKMSITQQRRVLAHLTNRLTMRASTPHYKWLSKRAYEWMDEYIRMLVPADSRAGFIDEELKLRQLVRPQLTRRSESLSQKRLKAGQLIFFRYKATTVEMFDKFPCVMVLRPANRQHPRNFLGANFHYLPPVYRLMWFDLFLKMQGGSLPERTMSPERASTLMSTLVDKYPIMGGAYHQYRFENCLSPALIVPQEEWMYALSMPVHQPTVPISELYRYSTRKSQRR